MSRAVRFHSIGGPEVLVIEDLTLHAPGAGEIAVRVAPVGLNRSDSMYFRGHFKEQPELPSGIGAEMVGTVISVGPGGNEALIGQRVGAIPGFSTQQFPVLGEEALIPAGSVAPMPEVLSDIEGAAVWMQYATAYGALVEFGKVVAGEHILITAASSSVGLAASQIVKAQGAISIVTTRTARKREELLSLGADHVIVTEEEDLAARVHEITGGKLARIVFDSVGGDYINVLGQCTANGGSIYLYGLLAGQPTPFPMSIFARGIAMYGYSLGQLNQPEQIETMKRYIVDHLSDGTFKPKIARTFPLARVVEAYQYLESNEQVGKIVITI